MAQKKKIPQKKTVPPPPPVLAKAPALPDSLKWVGIAMLVTLVCFYKAFKNDFTNWDDVQYVLENNLIKSLSWHNIKEIFTTRSVMGNYHPLAVLSLAIDYYFHKLNAPGYHTTAIIMHLCNVALVFYFIKLLTDKPIVAFMVALLFGIHPMHVESVAWVAERKDVLYVFFYISSLITYLLYLKEPQKRVGYIIATFIIFGLSVLSKAQAVTLPVVLVLIDYYKNRKFEMWTWLEKIPFLLFSLGMGYVAVLAQKETGAIKDVPNNPFMERVLFAGYSFIDYAWRLIYPEPLSAYYPYPEKPFPVIFYIAPFIAGGLVTVVAKYYKNKTVVLGAGFYIANIFLLLQLLPVGGAMMADRYSYLCSIGLFFIIANYLYDFWQDKKYQAYKYPVMAVAMGYGIFLCYDTSKRTRIWKDSGVLWQNVISQYKNIPIAYNNLGSFYQKHNSLDSAFMYFNEAIRLKSSFPEARTNRSDIFRVKGKFDLAVADCDTAIAADRNYTEAYMNRGIAYCNLYKLDDALRDFSFVLSKRPGDASLYSNQGNLYDMKKKYDSALADYAMVMQLDPENGDIYASRGRTYYEMGKFKEALADLDKAIEMHVNNPTVYIYHSQTNKELGNYAAALQDATNAAALGAQINQDYISDLKKRMQGAK